MKILITEFMDAPAVAQLAARFHVVYDPALVDDRAALLEKVAGCDGLIVRNRTQVDRTLLAVGAKLRVIGRLGVGLDNIDVAACGERGVAVLPATGANARAVAEYVVTTAAMLLRGAYTSSAAVAAGGWPRAALSRGRELADKTIGLVGFGSIGQLTGKLAAALDMHVVAHDPLLDPADPAWQHATRLSLDALLAACDVVSLHVPLVPGTHRLIDGDRITRMKPGALLVNTSRGGIVDEAALAAALRSGHLGGAALDVFENEPLPAGSALVDVPNLILTPHIAGVTEESNRRVSALIAEKVALALAALEAAPRAAAPGAPR